MLQAWLLPSIVLPPACDCGWCCCHTLGISNRAAVAIGTLDAFKVVTPAMRLVVSSVAASIPARGHGIPEHADGWRQNGCGNLVPLRLQPRRVAMSAGADAFATLNTATMVTTTTVSTNTTAVYDHWRRLFSLQYCRHFLV